MAFDLHITIPDNSVEANVLEAMVNRDHVTPEEVVRRALRQMVVPELTPAQELIGAFSSPEDAAVLDQAMASVREHRADYDRVRDFGF